MSVEQQVNDMIEALSGLLSELQSLRKTVLYSGNYSLYRNVDGLLKENRKPTDVIPKENWLIRLDDLPKTNLDNMRKESTNSNEE